MDNYNEDIFRFENDESEQTNEFTYNNISGLGESNYENEDLFVDENYEDNYRSVGSDELSSNYEINNNDFNNSEYFIPENTDFLIPKVDFEQKNDYVLPVGNEEPVSIENTDINPGENNEATEFSDYVLPVENEDTASNYTEEPVSVENTDINPAENNETTEFNDYILPVETVDTTNDSSNNNENDSNTEDKIKIADTPIEELNKLTEYKEEEIDTTDINSLFNKVNVNVKEASDVFKKNTDLKKKIDSRFEELKKLQSEIENSKKQQLDEIDKYKEDVLVKLTNKKDEIEKRLNLLKESQATLEKEKKEFEQYKNAEQDKIDKIKKDVQAAYDERREELNHIEDVLRKQKDSLDEERNQLSLDRIQYESDKNELANNLLKFNELVNSFTNGVQNIEE